MAALPLMALWIGDGLFKRELYAYSAAAFWALDVLTFVLLPVSALWALRTDFGIRPAQYGLGSMPPTGSWLRFFGYVALVSAVLAVVYREGRFLASWFVQPSGAELFYPAVLPDGPLRMAAVLYFAVTAAVAEEIVFRGLPLLYLEKIGVVRLRRTIYVLGTSALFAAGHWESGAPVLAGAFAYGVVCAAFYLRLRDLWPFIFAHALIDVWELS